MPTLLREVTLASQLIFLQQYQVPLALRQPKRQTVIDVCYLGPAEESSWTEEPPVLLLVATGGEPLPAVLTRHPLLDPFHWQKKILLAAVVRIRDILVDPDSRRDPYL
jgi:hypothetical protein